MGFFDQMKQVGELKAKMEAVKHKLDEAEIETENEFLKIVVSGNRKIKSIEYKTSEGASLILLTNTINEALEKAEQHIQTEMMGVMPNIPGL